MTGDALDRLRRALEDHGCTVRGTAAQCPAPDHDDRQASLSIGQGRDGAVLNCHKGCATDTVLEALGMSAADLFDEPRRSDRNQPVTIEYRYTDEHGNLLFVKVRKLPKTFWIKRPDGRGGWIKGIGDARRVLYNLPAVLDAIASRQPVFLVEGEKDADAIGRAGAVATCNFDGASEDGRKPKWRPEYGDVLKGAIVIVVADKDDPGRKHASAIKADLEGKAESVAVMEAAAGKDAADHLAAGHGLGDFRPVSEAAETAEADDGLAAIAAQYTPVDWTQAWEEQPTGVDWLVEPVLETGTINVLFAKPGIGKSLLALDMAHQLVRDGHTVVYVDDENRIIDLVERLQAFGATPAELGRLRCYSFAGLPPLDTPAGGMHLLALAATAGASLVVMDTTSRMIAGNENDATTFLQLYRCSLVPLKKRGITVLRLDHPGKDDGRGQRGSSAKDGDADTIWKLTEEAKGLRYTLHRDKSRSGHGDAEDIKIARRYAPLRHEWTVPDSDRENKIIGQVCGQLSALGVPPSAGRDRCRTALETAGIRISNAQLSKVVRQRRYAPDSLGQPDSPVPRLPTVRNPPTLIVGGLRTGEQSPAPDSGATWPEDTKE